MGEPGPPLWFKTFKPFNRFALFKLFRRFQRANLRYPSSHASRGIKEGA